MIGFFGSVPGLVFGFRFRGVLPSFWPLSPARQGPRLVWFVAGRLFPFCVGFWGGVLVWFRWGVCVVGSVLLAVFRFFGAFSSLVFVGVGLLLCGLVVLCSVFQESFVRPPSPASYPFLFFFLFSCSFFFFFLLFFSFFFVLCPPCSLFFFPPFPFFFTR